MQSSIFVKDPHDKSHAGNRCLCLVLCAVFPCWVLFLKNALLSYRFSWNFRVIDADTSDFFKRNFTYYENNVSMCPAPSRFRLPCVSLVPPKIRFLLSANSNFYKLILVDFWPSELRITGKKTISSLANGHSDHRKVLFILMDTF